jgi:RNA polymerase sigma-70 factor (ECF subfamily)
VLEEIPLDEVVRHLGSNRNAVYKLVHDARLKLRRHLERCGFDVTKMADLAGPDR